MVLIERRRSRAAQSRIYSRTLIINILRFLWIVVLVWGEFGIYFWSLSACKWPELSATYAKPTHVLLVSDVQVEHPSIFSHDPSWIGFFRHLIYDLYLKRSWRVTKHLKPGVVIFLGDMLTTGKFSKSENEYKQYFDKFRRTFSLDPDTLVYYLPGNNDVGMGVTRPSSKHVRQSFLRMFGPFNQRVILHNHTFVLLDAPGLVDEDYARSAKGLNYNHWDAFQDGPVEFVKSVGSGEHPLILLSHIPFWRVDTAPCGPSRERGNIHQGVGHGYQNMLGKQTTSFLLETLRPSIIFSGDNRDYCEYYHNVKPVTHKEAFLVPEVTVKSFSTTRHIRRPGFQLLSLTSPSQNVYPQKSFADRPCLLPSRDGIYGKLYPEFAILTLLMIVIFNIQRSRRLRQSLFISSLSLPRTHNSRVSPHSPDAETSTPYPPPTPTSPRSSLPASLRAPHTSSEPTFRSASQPSTPTAQVSPLLSPMIYPLEEMEDSLYPAQYARRLPVDEQGSWSPDNDFNNPIGSLSFPRHEDPSVTRYRWSWSWTLVFRGRRRRVTIYAPSLSWTGLKDLIALLGDGVAGEANFRRRGLMKSSVMDLISVAWLSTLVWIIMAWWSF